jgi:hypothetical protein
MKRTPVYTEDKPDRRFLTLIRNWLKDRKLVASALLVSKSNLVIAVIQNRQADNIICFYMQKLCALGTGGMIVYYDLDSMSTRLKVNVENTFTNWLAQHAIN